MKSKGFTLIELLAVIVILAVIALIATPLIMNVINDAKVNSLKDSAYGVLEASNFYYAQYEPEGNVRFDIEDNQISSNDSENMLQYDGYVKKGTVILNKSGNTTLCITDGTNSAYKNYNDDKVLLAKNDSCYIPANKAIVYLEGSGATRSELSNQELTDLVTTLQEKINSLETKLNAKADQTDLNSIETQVETIGTIANNAQTLGTNAATKTELSTLASSVNNNTSSINSLNAVNVYSANIDSQYFYSANVHPIAFRKVGNTCTFFWVSAITNLPSQQSTVVGTMPSECIPKQNFNFFDTNTNGGFCRIQISLNTSGKIVIYNYCSYTGAMNVSNSFTYPIK